MTRTPCPHAVWIIGRAQSLYWLGWPGPQKPWQASAGPSGLQHPSWSSPCSAAIKRSAYLSFPEHRLQLVCWLLHLIRVWLHIAVGKDSNLPDPKSSPWCWEPLLNIVRFLIFFREDYADQTGCSFYFKCLKPILMVLLDNSLKQVWFHRLKKTLVA